MQLTPVARPPAGHVLTPLELKPVAAKGAVANMTSYGLLRRRTDDSSSLLPAPCNVRRMGRRSCPAARTKARDEAEPEPQPQAPAKEGEEAAPAGGGRGERSIAYGIFEGVYLCAYVLSCRIGELIVANAQDAIERLRRYVLDNFNQKR
jgi:hypothetical protein